MPNWPESQWNFLRRLPLKTLQEGIVYNILSDIKPDFPRPWAMMLQNAPIKDRLELSMMLDTLRRFAQREWTQQGEIPNQFNGLMEYVSPYRFSDIKGLEGFSPVTDFEKKMQFIKYLQKTNRIREEL